MCMACNKLFGINLKERMKESVCVCVCLPKFYCHGIMARYKTFNEVTF